MSTPYQKVSDSGTFDSQGSPLNAFDIVRIVAIPAIMANEIDENGDNYSFYSNFVGSIGIISYSEFADGDKYIWHSDDKNTFYVNSIQIKENEIFSYGISLPSYCLLKCQNRKEIYAAAAIIGGIRNWVSRDDYPVKKDGETNYYEYLKSLLKDD